jgi:hypothetical protein
METSPRRRPNLTIGTSGEMLSPAKHAMSPYVSATTPGTPSSPGGTPMSPAQRIMEDRQCRLTPQNSPAAYPRTPKSCVQTVQVKHMRDGMPTPDAECLSPVPFMVESAVGVSPTPPRRTPPRTRGDRSPPSSPSAMMGSAELDAHMTSLEAEISGLPKTQGQQRRALPSLGAPTQQLLPTKAPNYDRERGVGQPDLAQTRRLGLPTLSAPGPPATGAPSCELTGAHPAGDDPAPDLGSPFEGFERLQRWVEGGGS